MSNNLKSLEHQADHHRLQAHAALAGLFNAFAPAKMGTQAMERASGATDDLAKTALHHAKANPAGLAMMGVGAALIALNRPKPTRRQAYGTEEGRIARADAQIQEKARVTANTPPQSASTMRKMLHAGLDRLSPEARKRVIDARLKAIDAQEKVEREARRIGVQAKEAHQSQPFVTALALAGIGALLGSLLPSTRTEGALLGAKRDQLMRSAEVAVRSEIAELEARGKAAATAAAREGRDAFKADPATV